MTPAQAIRAVVGVAVLSCTLTFVGPAHHAAASTVVHTVTASRASDTPCQTNCPPPGNGGNGQGCQSSCPTPPANGNGCQVNCQGSGDNGQGCQSNCPPPSNGNNGQGCQGGCPTPPTNGNGCQVNCQGGDNNGQGCQGNCTPPGNGQGCQGNCTPPGNGRGCSTNCVPPGNGGNGQGCQGNCTPPGNGQGCQGNCQGNGNGCQGNCTPPGNGGNDNGCQGNCAPGNNNGAPTDGQSSIEIYNTQPYTVLAGSTVLIYGQNFSANSTVTFESTTNNQASYSATNVHYYPAQSNGRPAMLACDLPSDIPADTYDVSVDNGDLNATDSQGLTVVDPAVPLSVKFSQSHGKLRVDVTTDSNAFANAALIGTNGAWKPIMLKPLHNHPGLWEAVWKPSKAAGTTLYIMITAGTGRDNMETLVRSVSI